MVSASLSYMNQETPCQLEIVDPVGYHCMLVSSTFCIDDVRWRDPSALCPGMQFRSWLAADSGSAYQPQRTPPQHHRPVMTPHLLVCNCNRSLGSLGISENEVVKSYPKFKGNFCIILVCLNWKRNRAWSHGSPSIWTKSTMACIRTWSLSLSPVCVKGMVHAETALLSISQK